MSAASPAPTLAHGRDDRFAPRLARRRLVGLLFAVVCVVMSGVAVLVLGVLLWEIGRMGAPVLRWEFLSNPPSSDPAQAGVWVALAGSIWVIAITAAVSIPLGVGAAVYLEEYAPNNRLTRAIALNISNLAGVPSVVYGLLGLAIFVRWASLGGSVASAGLTLALLVLPVIIIASREAIAAVPSSIRMASYGLGATRWQTVRHHVLPAAIPGIMTGVILSLSRAIGEAAPLLVLGVVDFYSFAPGEAADGADWTPRGLLVWIQAVLREPFSVLPVQIYGWIDRPEDEFKKHLSAAGIMVLLGVLLSMNAAAIGIRAWHQRKRLV